jgi:hypothetical protein
MIPNVITGILIFSVQRFPSFLTILITSMIMIDAHNGRNDK